MVQRTGQDRTGQDRTGQDRTGQDRTGQTPSSPDLLTNTGVAEESGEEVFDWVADEVLVLSHRSLHHSDHGGEREVRGPRKGPQLIGRQVQDVE